MEQPSIFWLFPRSGANASDSWTGSDVLFTTPSKTYTAGNVTEALRDLGYDAAAAFADQIAGDPDLSAFAAPGVNTYVAYGTDIPTLVGAVYAVDFTPAEGGSGAPPQPAKVVYGSGDDVVPLRSSLRGYQWAGAQAQLGFQLIHEAFPGQVHAMCTIIDPVCFAKVVAILTGNITAAH